jgi:serine/threonine-protein kinase
MRDVRMMYSEVAQVIAHEMKIGLTQQEETRFADARQVIPESYDAWLRGWVHLDRPTPEGLKLALQYFGLALEIDPNNALAHVGVAEVWMMRYLTGQVPHQEAIPLITTPIEKALELDNTLAEAHAALAGYRVWHEWDWEGAEKAYQQALWLNPNLAGAHGGYSYLLCFMGRIEEALPHIELALELDPLSPTSHFSYGQVLGYFHLRLDDAISAFRNALEIEPNFFPALVNLCNVLAAKGMYDEALAILRKIHADDAELTKALEDGFEKGGYEGAARALADLMAEWYGTPRGIDAMGIASWYLHAGDIDLTIDWLEKAYQEHNLSLPYISAWGDPFRSNPRFQELLRKMNLPTDEKE